MNKKEDIETRLAELRAEREQIANAIESARVEAKEAVINGEKPSASLAALVEQSAILDEAIAELAARSDNAAHALERAARKRRAEAALEATANRTKLAVAVDDAITALATSWTAYAAALRKEVGQVSGAGGDVTSVERSLTTNRQAEPLVKAVIQAGGQGLARSLGIDTPIRERHCLSLADAEERVAASLRATVLRVKAESPQTNLAREAKAELEKMEPTQ